MSLPHDDDSYDAVLRDLDALGCKVRHVRTTWPRQARAHCPGHEDDEPSLIITEGETQKYVVFCHGGCSPERVLEKIGRTLKDACHHSARQAPRARPALYREADLGDGITLWLPADRRGVEALRALGLSATCSTFAFHWARSFTARLLTRGVRVVLVPVTNSPPGEKHARHVARSFTAAARARKLALDLRLVRFTEHGPNADVLVFLNAHAHDPDMLDGHVHGLPTWREATATERRTMRRQRTAARVQKWRRHPDRQRPRRARPSDADCLAEDVGALVRVLAQTPGLSRHGVCQALGWTWRRADRVLPTALANGQVGMATASGPRGGPRYAVSSGHSVTPSVQLPPDPPDFKRSQRYTERETDPAPAPVSQFHVTRNALYVDVTAEGKENKKLDVAEKQQGELVGEKHGVGKGDVLSGERSLEHPRGARAPNSAAPNRASYPPNVTQLSEPERARANFLAGGAPGDDDGPSSTCCGRRFPAFTGQPCPPGCKVCPWSVTYWRGPEEAAKARAALRRRR